MTSEWQPIETAPKDGTSVLVVSAGGTPVSCRFDNERWTHVEDNGELIMLHAWGGVVTFYADNPTHWQPLPEPPK